MDHLKKNALNAIGWDFLGVFATQGVNFIVSIFLARLLTPEDFGLIGMAMVFIVVFQTMADLGFSTALIQNRENSNLIYSSVFWLNVGFGIIVYVVFYFCAPAIAKFYESPQMTPLIRWLALILPISTLNLVQVAILKRDLKFKLLSIRLLVAGAVSGVVGVTMAFGGYEVYALVIQQLLLVAVSTVVLWKVSTWRPDLKFSLPALRGIMSVSIYVFLGSTLNRIVKKVDALVIGKVFSPATLGFFTRAESLNSLVSRYSSEIVGRVFLPVMSKLQDEPSRFQSAYLSTLSYLAFLVFLLSGVLIISGEFLIVSLFGVKWLPSVFIFQVLMFKMFNTPINFLIVNAFYSMGKAREDFWVGNIRKIVQLVPFFFAVSIGFNAFLYALVGVSSALTLFNIYMMDRYLKINANEQLRRLLLFFLPFLLSLAPYFFGVNFGFGSTFFEVLFGLIVFVIIYLGVIFLVDQLFLVEMLANFRFVLNKNKSLKP